MGSGEIPPELKASPVARLEFVGGSECLLLLEVFGGDGIVGVIDNVPDSDEVVVVGIVELAVHHRHLVGSIKAACTILRAVGDISVGRVAEEGVFARTTVVDADPLSVDVHFAIACHRGVGIRGAVNVVCAIKDDVVLPAGSGLGKRDGVRVRNHIALAIEASESDNAFVAIDVAIVVAHQVRLTRNGVTSNNGRIAPGTTGSGSVGVVAIAVATEEHGGETEDGHRAESEYGQANQNRDTNLFHEDPPCAFCTKRLSRSH